MLDTGRSRLKSLGTLEVSKRLTAGIAYLGFGTDIQAILLQHANQCHLGFKQGEAHTDAVTRTEAERHPGAGLNGSLVLSTEPGK